MQNITYSVHLPILHEIVTMSMTPTLYEVVYIENTQPCDSIFIRAVTNGITFHLVVTCGKWQINGYVKHHDIQFHGIPSSNIMNNYELTLQNHLNYQSKIPIWNITTPQENIKPKIENVQGDIKLKVNTYNDGNRRYNIRVGDTGSYVVSENNGTMNCENFVVTKILSIGKTLEIQFDHPINIGNSPGIRTDIKIIEYRSSGQWIFKGVHAKNFKNKYISVHDESTA